MYTGHFQLIVGVSRVRGKRAAEPDGKENKTNKWKLGGLRDFLDPGRPTRLGIYPINM